MRGHVALVDMRRAGVRPRAVFIDADRADDIEARDWQALTPYRAHVCIGPDEMLTGLDLRFVVGLPVLVTGADASRVARIAAACIDAGASRVTSAHVTTSPDNRANYEWRATVHNITTTLGGARCSC